MYTHIICIYIYIYIERERDTHTYAYTYTYIHIHMYYARAGACSAIGMPPSRSDPPAGSPWVYVCIYV